MSAQLFTMAAELARAEFHPLRERLDPVECSLHNLMVAVRALETEIAQTLNPSRAQQMADRLEVEMHFVCGLFEQARDKAALLNVGEWS